MVVVRLLMKPLVKVNPVPERFVVEALRAKRFVVEAVIAAKSVAVALSKTDDVA